jgi:cytochrome c
MSAAGYFNNKSVVFSSYQYKVFVLFWRLLKKKEIKMKKVVIFTLVVLFLFSGLVYAQKKATKESCQALVQKAVAYYKEVGKEKALAAFSDPKGKFVDGEDYLSVYRMQGTTIAHGTNAALIGKNWIELKDSNGKLFIKAFVDGANKPGASGWIDYYWTNPVTKKVAPKEAYFVRVDDVIIQAGYYK